MKQIMQTMCVLMLLAGVVFSANSRVLKSEINTKLQLLDINRPLQIVNFIIDHIIDNHKIDSKVVSIGKHNE